jgi:hypothetical protein
MKMDLLYSIGREYDWVLQTCAQMPRAERSGARGPREWSERGGPGEARRSRDIPPEK